MVNTKSVFGSIKERLGLDAQPQGGGYDEYDEFEDYEEDYDEAGEDDPGYSTRSTRGSRSSFSNIGLPHLVSRADAEESTRSRSIPLPSSSSRGGRTMVDSSLPPTMTPEGTAAVSAAGNRRSEGLDSLFSSTSSTSSGASSLPIIGAAASSSIAGKRQLQVIRPATYEDAEGVTAALKAGDVAVLVLGSVPDDLMHRMLDFSFGAASALGAAVECVAPKTFVICSGDSLSDMERVNLQTMGLI